MGDPGYKLQFHSGNNTSLRTESALDRSDTAPQRSPKRKTPQKLNRRPKTPTNGREEPSRGAVGTLMRTKRLLLAALRVWELKQGIRD